MTSMLLTDRRGTEPLSLLGAVTRSDPLLLGVSGSRLFDQRPHDRLIRLDPVGDELPLFAVPLLELHGAASLVIHAGNFDRLEQAERAELFQSLFVDVQVLQPPANLLSRQRLLPELGLRGADRLRVQDPVDDSPVVIHLAEAAHVFEIPLVPSGVNVLLDILENGEVRPGRMEGGGNEALGGLAGGFDILFGPAPPDSDDVIARVADLRRGLERDRIHDPPAAQNDPVRLGLSDLEPLRFLLVAGMRNLDVRDSEAVLLGLQVQDRDRLLSVGGAVVEVDDLLPLELVHSSRLHPEELDLGRALAPVVGHEREDVRKDSAVRCVRTPVADRDDRDLVGGRALDAGVSDAGRKEVEHRRARRTLLLQALVALDSPVVLVFGLALLPGQLDAVDTSV